MFRWRKRPRTKVEARTDEASAPNSNPTAGSKSENPEFDFADWVSSSGHLVPLKASRRQSALSEQTPHGREGRTNQQMREHGVTLALTEFYKLKQQYLEKKKFQRKERGARGTMGAFLIPPMVAGMERTRMQLSLDVAAWLLMQGAPIALTMMLFFCYTALRARSNLAVTGLASLALLLLTMLSERRIRHLASEAEQKAAAEASSAGDWSTAASPANQRTQGLSAKDIHTVPWTPARGPRLRAEPRSRKQQEELKRRSRAQAGRGMRGIGPEQHGSASEDPAALRQLRRSIAEVQTALYGEPAGGDFAARRMSLAEALLEVRGRAPVVVFSPCVGCSAS